MGLHTADANCCSDMSSTNIGFSDGSCGKASAEPIMRKVIPCTKHTNQVTSIHMRNVYREFCYVLVMSGLGYNVISNSR